VLLLDLLHFHKYFYVHILSSNMSARKSETLKFTGTSTSSKSFLSPDEAELCELAQLSGVAMDPKVFKYVFCPIIMWSEMNLHILCCQVVSGLR